MATNCSIPDLAITMLQNGKLGMGPVPSKSQDMHAIYTCMSHRSNEIAASLIDKATVLHIVSSRWFYRVRLLSLSKWKAGKQSVQSVCCNHDNTMLLTGGRSIKLWILPEYSFVRVS